MSATIIPERMQRIESIQLKSGSHSPRNGHAEFCVMEAVAYVAGEKHTDSPACVSPVIASFMRSWNDGLPNDAERDRLLKPLIPLLLNTVASEAMEDRRGWMALDWLVRECAPAFLDAAKLTECAEAMRAVGELRKVKSCEAAMRVILHAKEKSAAAWDAAGAAAWDAAGAAARAAARAAAGDAARAAAWAAARAAAGDAAWAAAWAAAGAALAPVVAKLQLSAVELVKRMCEAK